MKDTKCPVLQVGMGDGVVATAPHMVSSLGLGSCVAVALYDPRHRIGGLAHIMLPDSSQIRPQADDCAMRNRNPNSGIANRTYQYADRAIAALLKELQRMGAARRDIVAKMVGGARMFSDYEDGSSGIGEQNIAGIRNILRTEGIALLGEDVGGHHGRNAEFHLDSGKLIVKTIGKAGRQI